MHSLVMLNAGAMLFRSPLASRKGPPLREGRACPYGVMLNADAIGVAAEAATVLNSRGANNFLASPTSLDPARRFGRERHDDRAALTDDIHPTAFLINPDAVRRHTYLGQIHPEIESSRLCPRPWQKHWTGISRRSINLVSRRLPVNRGPPRWNITTPILLEEARAF